jgi:hypothetical protein
MFWVSGWEWSSIWCGRVGVVPCLGCPGGSGPVLGVAGDEEKQQEDQGSSEEDEKEEDVEYPDRWTNAKSLAVGGDVQASSGGG